MEIIKYHLNYDGEQGPECTMPYSEANMAIAEAEAYGEIAVEDDGTPEPVAVNTDLAQLRADIDYIMLMGGF